MNKFGKTIITVITIILVLSLILSLKHASDTNYMQHAPLNYALMCLALIVVIYLATKGLKFIWISMAFCAILTLQGCSYAKSNQQVLISSDCGVTWSKINPGESVPKAGMNPCYMKVVIPNYPMQGDSKFLSNLKGKVRVVVHIDYDYSITDALSFIKQAKSLGSSNSDVDSEEAITSNFESAENALIDKRIKEVAKDLFIEEDILELDQSKLEDRLLSLSNDMLKEFGVHLNFITLTFDLDEQTRQSIDILTAMKIYESRELSDVGKQIMIARAGATKILIESKTTEN